MTKNKKVLLTTACALALTTTLGVGVATLNAQATDVSMTDDGTWFRAPDLEGTGIPATWTFNGDGTLTNTNTAFTGNMLMTTNADLVGDYAVEAVFQGSNNTEVTKEINMGFTPWYQDAKNYVIVYMKWQIDHKFHLVNIQTAYVQEGVNNGGMNWGDTWLDHGYETTLYSLTPTDSIKMRVEKKYNAGTGLDEFITTVSSGSISVTPANRGIALSVPHAAKQATVGLYTCNDTVTVSNFKTESLTETGVYKTVNDSLGTTAKSSAANGWAFSGGNYTVNAAAGDSAANQAVMQNEFAAGNYEVSYTANCGTNGNQLSVLPLYSDENNYVRFVIDKTTTGANVSVEGKAAGTAFTKDAAAFTGTVDWTNVQISASRVGSRFACKINGATAASYSNTAFKKGANVGFGAGGASVSFGNVKVEELEYQAYDWFSFDEDWFASAKTMESVTITEGVDEESGNGNGKYTLTLQAPADETKYTAAYTDSDRYDLVTLSGKFTGTADAGYGFYTAFIDDDNYTLVLIADGKVTLKSMKEGTETTVEEENLPAGFNAAEENLLYASAEFDRIKVSLNGTEILTGTVAALAGSNTVKAGAVALGGTVTVKEMTIDGFWPYKTRTEGVWAMNGSRLNSWTVGDTAIVADGSYGTSFKNSIALSPTQYNPADGYYVGTKLTITELYESEWKTGVMPYYKDANNHVFVWLSQWANGSTTITITARLNGAEVGNEWRETAVAYTMKDAPNYLEVYVHGDAVYVYLNKSYAPTVTTSIEGLRLQSAAKIGLNNFNTSAKYEEVAVSNERIFTEEGTPTIETIGSVPTTGKAGESIKLPVFSATGVGGTAANVTISVKDADGKDYAVEKNGFTPDHDGKFTVTVTAKDAWGNEETKTYEIDVEKSGGCGSAIGAAGIAGVSAIAAIVLTVGALVAAKKKRAQ